MEFISSEEFIGLVSGLFISILLLSNSALTLLLSGVKEVSIISPEEFTGLV